MAKLYSYRGPQVGLSHSLDEAPDPEKFTLHTHSRLELYCFLQGRGVYHIEGSAYPLMPGDILLMQPGEAHYIALEPGVPYERIVVNFTPELLSPLDPKGCLLRPFYDRRPGEKNRYAAQYDFQLYLKTVIDPQGDPAINVLAGLVPLLNRLCRLQAQAPPQGDSLAHQIISYVNQNLSDPPHADALCQRFFLSKSQLGRLVRRSTGTTLWNYITRKRLAMARQLLRAGESPTQVFSRCGFRDYPSFYRAYVKAYGLPPSAEVQ